MFLLKCFGVFLQRIKNQRDVLELFEEVLDKIGKPQQIHHDNEGSFSSTEFTRLLNEHKIKQIIVSAKALFAERAVQTIRNMIHTRTEGLDLPVEKWVEMSPAILIITRNILLQV